jgi:site-specific DNA-cytosine methylase
VLDLVDCAWVHAQKRARFASTNEAIQNKLPDELIVDVSQNHCRRPLSNLEGYAPTLTTSSAWYHYGLDRQLTPREHLFLQGHSQTTQVPSEISSTSVRSLAGEAINLACLGCLVWSLHLTKDLTSL